VIPTEFLKLSFVYCSLSMAEYKAKLDLIHLYIEKKINNISAIPAVIAQTVV